MTAWKFPLSLSYNSEGVVDGQGAQLLRIISLFSICRFFRIRYRHIPIARIVNSEDRRSDEEIELYRDEELLFFNSLVNFPSDSPPKFKKGEEKYSIKDLSRRSLLRLVMKSMVMRKQLVVSVDIPQAVTDKWPRILDASQEELRKNISCYQEINVNAPEIAVHVRTNYNLFKMSNLSPGTIRRKTLLPDYYALALEKVSSKESKKEYGKLENLGRIHIHTDLYASDLINFKGDSKLKTYSDWFSSISRNGDVYLFHQAPIVKTFSDWAFAKVFIMSTSSLSYVAGMFNQNRVIYPNGHGHSKLKRWEIVD